MCMYTVIFLESYDSGGAVKRAQVCSGPREATQMVVTRMCGLKLAECTHNGVDPKCLTYTLLGKCSSKSRPITAIHTECLAF